MTSKTKINEKMKKKTNTILAEAIFLAKKNNLMELASKLAVPSRQHAEVNVEKINDSKKDIIIVPGKVLGSGEIKRKCKVYAMAFSEEAENKLKKAGCEMDKIINVLRKSKKIEGEILI